ncbi:unnamed protein product, partial [marine sediment metagenome]
CRVLFKKTILNNTQDLLDLMTIADENGARKIILYENNIHPDFK